MTNFQQDKRNKANTAKKRTPPNNGLPNSIQQTETTFFSTAVHVGNEPQELGDSALQKKLKGIRDQLAKKNESEVSNLANTTWCQTEIQEIISLISQSHDFISRDSEGYMPLGEINHWVKRGVFPADVLDTTIRRHNTLQGSSDNILTWLDKLSYEINQNNIEIDIEQVQNILATKPEKEALNYIYPKGSRLEGSTLLHRVVNKANYLHHDHPHGEEYKKLNRIIGLLIEHGANPNMPEVIDDEGRTALHSTVSFGNYELTEQLISQGADANAHGCMYRVTSLQYLVMTIPEIAWYSHKGVKNEEDQRYIKQDSQARQKIASLFIEQGCSPYAPTGPGPCNWRTNAIETANNNSSPTHEQLFLFFQQQTDINQENCTMRPHR